MGTDENIQRTLGRHETKLENLEKSVDTIDHKVDTLQASVNTVLLALAERRGGNKTLLWIISGVSSVVGAVFGAIIPLFFHR